MIFRSRRDAWGGWAAYRRAVRRSSRAAIADRTLEDLRGIKQSRWRRAAGEERGLLLLRTVGHVRVEGYGQERVVIKQAERAAQDCFAIALSVPGKARARGKVVFVTREALLNIERVLHR